MFSFRFDQLSAAVSSSTYTKGEIPLSEDAAMEELCRALKRVKGIVYLIGNGGSAGIASHISADFIKTLKIPSMTLYDSNLMTCLSNDWGYETVFSYPLEHLLKEGDLLIAISSSGKSPNIVKAAEVAKARHIPLITLSGFQPSNPLRALGELNVWIDRSDYGLVETAHFFILHTLVDYLNKVIPTREEHACQCR